MKLFIYDCEVFKYDNFVVFKDFDTGEYSIFHNDGLAVGRFLDSNAGYIGFNSKNYDQFIIKGMCKGLPPQDIKLINDYIIVQRQSGYHCSLLEGKTQFFHNIDMMDDTQTGMSLKAFEAHSGMDIEETEVDFDLDRPLTQEELEMTIEYCKHDVDATEQLTKLRKSYLDNKLLIAKMVGLDPLEALGMTNAKLTAKMLKATKTPHQDEREYRFPENLRIEAIPLEVLQFFDKLHDPTIPDEKVFKDSLKIKVGDCPITLAYGGIHGAIPNFEWREHDDRIIRNVDVGSYYPHLMTNNGYTSRNIPSPQLFEDVLERRMAAKKAGDKATANALKLIVNTTYGATNAKFNDLYDPLMAHSVCVSGQLYLLELAERCYSQIEGLRIVQVNTDGLMVELSRSQHEQFMALCDEWQARTGFTLEEDEITYIIQKDVNNYIAIEGDSTKLKGGYLVRGVSTAGAFKINNSMIAVANAVKAYFLDGLSARESIMADNDISHFQIIAKAGASYKTQFHTVNGKEVPVQKVNRVYSSADKSYGKLFKVKPLTDSEDSTAMIASLPDHCIIDNDNHLSIEAVDKEFYIALAEKQIQDFKGKQPERSLLDYV